MTPRYRVRVTDICQVEFVLSLIKIAACIGFIILGIVINVGGVGDQGYLGAKYWYDPGAFQNGFNGFAGVFVVAAFAFGGTELVGLAAAEVSTPKSPIPPRAVFRERNLGVSSHAPTPSYGNFVLWFIVSDY